MPLPIWMNVRRDLGRSPIVEGHIGGSTPLYIERYVYQTIECTVSGLAATSLVTQFGGGRVSEGEPDHLRSMNLPTQSLLVPAGVPTHWHYSGTVDYAVFYFLEGANSAMQSLSVLAAAHKQPLPFSDQLVGASALQLVNELQKGRQADEGFMERLAGVMLEQVFRVLTTSGTRGINARHVHFSRLQKVLNHIHEHLTEDLSAEVLARRADVSLAHFRRIFEEAMGVPPHRYIVGARLEQARKLLTVSSMPISRIAQECGFSSQSHLTACFRAAHAVTPAGYRTSVGFGARS
ncbi:MAG: helix-turn-helix transcriptional regulator [Rhodocyclaceae bacterium]|nr:helix-turn-helix transcriptional regulator [Rhodocyclaceae bacterium]MBL0075720.1 helix-turn-helix transcriptional regulator [Rhodocyclaceae bacterium]MBP7081976.1 helix-turn-helix transcriptional regulator [Rhodocyclaceae bacterium]